MSIYENALGRKITPVSALRRKARERAEAKRAKILALAESKRGKIRGKAKAHRARFRDVQEDEQIV